MNNLFNNLTTTLTSSINNNAGVSTTGSNNKINNSNISLNDIPKEELINLLMKMQKRMQLLESKGKELVRKKSMLLLERSKLVELMKSNIQIPFILKDENDIDLILIENLWNEYLSNIFLKDQMVQKKYEDLQLKHRQDITDLQSNLIYASSNNHNNNATGSDETSSESYDNNNKINELLKQLNDVSTAKEKLEISYSDIEYRYQKLDAEYEKLRGSDAYLKKQVSSLEDVISANQRHIVELQKIVEESKNSYEEKVVYLQMQLTNVKSKDDSKVKEMGGTIILCLEIFITQ